MANRSSTPNSRIPEPWNSIAVFRTSSRLKRPQSVTITSLPVTPVGREPRSSTFTTGGTCHQVRPVAQIEAASVRTTGVPRQPTPPYILECESEATVSVLGNA
ncbi:hypothetical protein BC938DRAFT_483099 [Jimgerdemannia flammicorona]|uniref:Uncharacterized protein n=1 Tax=Jimgerdemannia flammicorona TaxID=994334 RepID=A0A433QCK3_9FUNG|nr:hypothetical protein BC938DRAFT_483099 [Jimgerdemannia flammicorona]